MANIGTVEGVLKLKDLFTPVLEENAKALERHAKKAEDFGKRLTSVGAKLTAGITLPIAAVGAAAIKMAVDAVEAENLFEVSFGNMADAAREWSETTGKALGLNRVELRKQSATIFTMVESMGLARDESFDMATGITQLAADMASFYNLPHDEAFNKIRSGITGEAEPLKRLGILVDQNTVQMAAYQHGIAEYGAELTNTQKVQARWAAILDQTSKAQGDLARTLESPANRLRALKTRFEEILITLGTALLPAFERTLELVDSLTRKVEVAAGWFSNLPPPMQTVIVALAGIAAAVGPVLIVTGQLAIAWGAIATTALPALSAAFSATLAVLTGPVGWIAAGALIIASWKPARELFVSLVSTAITPFVAVVKSAAKATVDWWKKTEQFRSVLAEVAKILGRSVLSALSKVVAGIKEAGKWVASFASGVKILVEDSTAAQVVFDTLKGGLKTLGNAIKFAADWWGRLIEKMDIVKRAKFNAEFNQSVDRTRQAMQEAGKSADEFQALLDSVVPPGKRAKAAIEGVKEELKQLIDDHIVEDNTDAIEEFHEAYEVLNETLSDISNLQGINELMSDFALSSAEAAEAAALMAAGVANELAVSLAQQRTALEEHRQFLDDLQNNRVLQPMEPEGGGKVKPGASGNLEIKRRTNLLEEQAEAVEEQNKHWKQVANTVANAFGPALNSISDGLGDMVVQAIQLVDLFKAYQNAEGKGAKAAAGAAFGAGLGNFAQGLGITQGNRGESQFGGQMSGDYSQLGATVGGLFGPWGAVIGLVVGAAIKQGADDGLAEIRQSAGDARVSILQNEGGLGDIAFKVGESVLDMVENFAARLGTEVASVAHVSFKIRNETITVFIGNIRKEFESMEEAVRFAAIQTFARSTLADDVGEAVRAALEFMTHTAEDSIEEFERAMEIAIAIDTVDLSDEAKEMRQAFIEIEAAFNEFVDAAVEWSLPLEQVAKVGVQFGNDWRSLRDSITGTQRSERQIFEERRRIFNAELQLKLSELKSLREELAARIELAQGRNSLQSSILNAEMVTLEARQEMLRAEIGMAGIAFRMAGALGGAVAASAGMISRLERELAAIDSAIRELEGIDPIAAGEFRPSGGGGPSPAEIAAQDMERLNDILRQSAREGMTDYARALSDIQTRWDEAVPLAHENQALLDQIAAARRREVDALREQTRQGLESDIDNFVGSLSSVQGAIDSVSDASGTLYDRIQDAMQDGVLDFVDGMEAIQEVMIAANEQLHRISQSGFADLAGSLADVVQDEALRNQLIAQMEQVNFILQMQRLRAEYDALLGLGMLTQAQIDLLDNAFAWVDENMDTILASFGNAPSLPDGGIFAGTTTGKHGGADSTVKSDYEDLLQQIQDGIDAWMAIDTGPATKSARQMLADLDQMHDLLDQTLETGSGLAVWEYAENLKAINEAFDYAIGAFVNEILGPFEDSGLSDLEEEYADLQEQFWDIAQAFEELGLGAEEMARLTAAQQQALAAFWADATSGIQGIIERLTGVESGRAPLDLLAEQQADVEELFARAMSGDLSALEELEGEADDLLDLINQVYGSGRAGGILREQLLEMLEAVAGLDPSEVLGGSSQGGQAFDIADYFSGTGSTGIQADMSSALKTHREEMQAYETERDRVQMQQMNLKHQQDMVQRAELIRLTRELTKTPIKEGGQLGV